MTAEATDADERRDREAERRRAEVELAAYLHREPAGQEGREHRGGSDRHSEQNGTAFRDRALPGRLYGRGIRHAAIMARLCAPAAEVIALTRSAEPAASSARRCIASFVAG